MKKIMICDINIQQKGHYISYNQFILDNYKQIEATTPDIAIYFLYNYEAQLYLNTKHVLNERITFFEKGFYNRDDYKSRSVIFKKVITACTNKKIDQLLFLDLDQYQLQLFFSKIKFMVSGILFRPHHRIQYSNRNLNSIISTQINRYKKIVLERLLLSRNFIKSIFILNDEEGVQFLNRKYKTGVFKYLPDPIFSYNNKVEKTATSVYTYLIFGAISERKNISNIIKAYDMAAIKFDSCLQIVGKGEAAYQLHLDNLIANCKNIDGTHKKINIQNSFVTDAQMDAFFSMSDACLLIYKDFYGSSGLLGRAALHGKKVIASNVGLVAQIIKKYHLGSTCDPLDMVEIATRLAAVKDDTSGNYDGAKFYREHQPEKFLEILLHSNNKHSFTI